MSRFAIIDKNGVHVGFQRPALDKALLLIKGERAVPVPDDCDLVPGQTRWDTARAQFVFLSEEPQPVETPNIIYVMPASDGRGMFQVRLSQLDEQFGDDGLPDADYDQYELVRQIAHLMAQAGYPGAARALQPPQEDPT